MNLTKRVTVTNAIHAISIHRKNGVWMFDGGSAGPAE
jgi:hypothetical protein